MRRWIVLFLLAGLSGCGNGVTSDLNPIYAPTDTQVFVQVFNNCIVNARIPNSTHYNDTDELIVVCSGVARSQSRYCPQNIKCAPDLLPRHEVRSILPKESK